MTSSHPRPISISLDDDCGTGGQTRLGRLLGWHNSTEWRKLTGRSLITQSDELAIQPLLEKLPFMSPATPMTTQK
jgi:hypothetical protein